MKWIVFCLIAGVTVALASACGGDDGSSESSFEQYFREFRMVEKRADERSEEIEQEFDDPLGDLASGSFDERRVRFEELLDETLEVFDDYLSDARDLKPPGELRELHERYLDAVDGMREALAASAENFGDADSLQEAIAPQEAIALETELDASAERARLVCEELEAVAGDRDIEVDLECGSD